LEQARRCGHAMRPHLLICQRCQPDLAQLAIDPVALRRPGPRLVPAQLRANDDLIARLSFHDEFVVHDLLNEYFSTAPTPRCRCRLDASTRRPSRLNCLIAALAEWQIQRTARPRSRCSPSSIGFGY